MTEVEIVSSSQPHSINRQPPRHQPAVHPRRMITGGGQQRHPRRSKHPQFHLPHQPSPQQLLEIKHAQIAEDEIKQSATHLLQNSAGLLSTDDPHAKRFKKEIAASVAIPHLLKNHLGWVSDLPQIGQLGALVVEKWLRSKLEVE